MKHTTRLARRRYDAPVRNLTALAVFVILVPAALARQAQPPPLEQPQQNRQHPGQRGAGPGQGMSVEQLRQLGIDAELDVPYAADDNPRHRLDIYQPSQRNAEKLPAIVFIHGGGWRQGDKMMGGRRVVPFVRSGNYVGISVGYRLSDEAIWPAQIHDVKAAIRFIRANADKYGIDPQKIGLIGPSAGGHLVLMLGTSGDVPELEGELGEHVGTSSRVTCVANLFGVAELGAMVGQESNIDRRRADSPEALLLGGLISENKEKARQASPVTWITPDDPPVLSVHGDVDRVVPYDQSVRLDKALENEGVTSYFVTVRGGGHGDFGDAAAEPLRQFFAKYLLGREVEISEAAIQKPEGPPPGQRQGQQQRLDD